MRFEREIHVYTDGACEPNPGVGGWGSVILNPNTNKTISLSDGPYLDVTNNKMELLAPIRALNFLHRRIGPSNVVVYTDSKYVQNGITKWIHGWKKNNWVTTKKSLVQNAGLWQQLDKARNKHTLVAFKWVKGHADNEHNNAADKLACDARLSSSRPLDISSWV